MNGIYRKCVKNKFTNVHAQLATYTHLLAHAVYVDSGGSGEAAHLRRFVWVFADRICDKYRTHMCADPIFFCS